MALLGFGNCLLAEDKVIQEEEMSFKRCVKVIEDSSSKLSIAPKILNISEKKRVAVFTLADGELKITCNGNDNLIIVSTHLN